MSIPGRPSLQERSIRAGRFTALAPHRPDDAMIGTSLLFWRVGARSGSGISLNLGTLCADR
jgi:hypothetical protein